MDNNHNTIKAKTETTGKEDPVEVYANLICYYLDEYCEQGGISDLRQISQSRWNSALFYIYQRAFKDSNMLKAEPFVSYEEEDNKRRNFHHSNLNAYDLKKISAVLEVYENLCFEHEKEISIYGFSRLTGLDRETIYGWANDSKADSRSFNIYKEIKDSREESLSDKLYSGRGNPVATLGILNRWYGWNMGQPHGETKKETRSVEEIQQRYISSSVEQAPGDSQELLDFD